jgi:2-oxoisovalerate dehydrogenase E1 component
MLYRSIEGEVPEQYYEVPIGKAKCVNEGEDVSIIAYGAAVHWALKVAQEFKDISIDILDLRTLLPLDYDAIEQTVKKTGKVIVVHEDTLIGGIGAEIAAHINEHFFSLLDAPVIRSASLDTPVPFAVVLEDNFLAKGRLKSAIERLINY